MGSELRAPRELPTIHHARHSLQLRPWASRRQGLGGYRLSNIENGSSCSVLSRLTTREYARWRRRAPRKGEGPDGTTPWAGRLAGRKGHAPLPPLSCEHGAVPGLLALLSASGCFRSPRDRPHQLPGLAFWSRAAPKSRCITVVHGPCRGRTHTAYSDSEVSPLCDT